jgi:hypothetical protein
VWAQGNVSAVIPPVVRNVRCVNSARQGGEWMNEDCVGTLACLCCLNQLDFQGTVVGPPPWCSMELDVYVGIYQKRTFRSLVLTVHDNSADADSAFVIVLQCHKLVVAEVSRMQAFISSAVLVGQV